MTTTRRNRSTGTTITWGRADELALDPAGGAWALVCRTHGTIVNVETRRQCERNAPRPENWCEGCNGAARPRTRTYPACQGDWARETDRTIAGYSTRKQ